ncbi:hypothetical protein GOP47_0017048 [Adiantum capillus-veneris]|uniref:Pentatricopeptide repeat-containing protein n=1 Tax=Adiantum capillus-veneris TaxID=13818 RepID=A0A9D4UJR8_ADICA|nr:hypothetical protein GOP47_0017048 [Adiantum capillus-veneris]
MEYKIASYLVTGRDNKGFLLRSTRTAQKFAVPAITRTPSHRAGRAFCCYVPAFMKRAGMKTMNVVQFVEESTDNEPPDFRKARRLVASALLGALMDRIKMNKWESALKVFKLLREQEWYEPDTGTYTLLIKMLGKCEKPDLAYSLYVLMQKEKCKPSVQVYTALLTAFARNNLLDRASQILEEMKRVDGCQPDVWTYSELIKAYSGKCDFEKVAFLLSEMKCAGLIPNTVTCNILLDAYGKVGMFDAMEGLFTQIFEGDEYSYNYWTQNVILSSYARVGNVERMEYWFSKLHRLGFRPNVITFNILLTAYGRERLFEKIESVLDFMHAYHYRGTTATYNTVIDAYGKAGNIKQAAHIYQEMRALGVSEDKHTFCSLINAYGKQGCWMKVEKVLRQMRNLNIEPDTAIYNAALDAYWRSDRKVEMHGVLMEMEDRGIKGDEYTKSILSKLFNGRLDGNIPN